jgi:hypothetical protein
VNLFVRRWHTELIAGMSHYSGPAESNFVARAERVFDSDLYVWERAAKAIYESEEFGSPMNFDAGPVLPDANHIFRHQLVNGLNASLVPDFLEPSAHQSNVFFYGHSCAPQEAAKSE